MANTFSKVDRWIANNSLMLLKHKLAICGFMRTDYVQEYKKEFAVGDTVRVKYPWRPITTTSMVYDPQNIERIETSVVVDQVVNSHFDYDSVEKLLHMERGEERAMKEYIEPAMTYIAAGWDIKAAQYIAQNTNNIVGVLGTNPSTFDSTSAAARQRMVELDCPESGDKGLFIPPAVMRSVKGGSGNMALFHPADEVRRMFKKGIVGQADDFEWSESMSLYTHTAGTWAGAVTLTSASANGDTSLAITCTSGDTFKKGDVIGIGSVYAVNPVTRTRAQSASTYTVSVKEDATASSTTVTVQINETIYFSGPYQNVDAQPAASATLTLFPGTTSPNGKSGKNGLAIHPDSFAFVPLPLPMPENEEKQWQKTDPETGVSIAFIKSFDPINRRWINRLDTIGGFGRLNVEACAVRVLCA